MKRKISTLELWYDDETENVSRLEGESRDGKMPDLFRLVLNPAYDHLHAEGTRNKKAVFASILAHEVGHWIAMLMGSKWQIPFMRQLSALPSEKEAWSLAHYVNPNINREVEIECLKSYEDKSIPEYAQKAIDAVFEETKIA
jgi:hypothetical protein